MSDVWWWWSQSATNGQTLWWMYSAENSLVRSDVLKSTLYFHFLPQVLSRQWNVLTSGPSIYSLTLCWTETSRAWLTVAGIKGLSTKASAWTVGGAAATHWATASRRSVRVPASGSTWTHALRCPTNVRGRHRQLNRTSLRYIYSSQAINCCWVFHGNPVI